MFYEFDEEVSKSMSFVISVSFDAFSLISFLGSISVGISFSC